MPMWLKILSDVLIACGAFFALVGVLGILRMPDTFCRMQASTCISTLGMLGVAVGGVLYAALIMHSASAAIKIAVIALMVLVTNPVGSHAIAKGAYSHGYRPEKKMETDDLGRDFDE